MARVNVTVVCRTVGGVNVDVSAFAGGHVGRYGTFHDVSLVAEAGPEPVLPELQLLQSGLPLPSGSRFDCCGRPVGWVLEFSPISSLAFCLVLRWLWGW